MNKTLCIALFVCAGLTGFAQSEEPLFFTADFNGMTDISLRPGEDSVIFYASTGAPDPIVSGAELGASGEPGDDALEIFFELQDPNFFGFLILLDPDASYDISGYERLEFDMRLGSDEGFSDWGVRLEDRDGEEEYLNTLLPIENLSTEWQSYSFPLTDFLMDSGSQAVDLAQVFQIVFSTSNVPSGTIVFDLYVDNIAILGEAETPVAPWMLH